jgi:DNA-binding PucR family transcriptional regulator
MPTLADLVAYPGLGLTVLAGEDLLDREIRWVATSEHPDPRPFLRGGELLLTTGMRLGASLAAVRLFAERLREAGVVAIGYGVGVTSDRVPARLQRAAAEHDLVVIEVDEPTPFIAISKAVSEMLATEQYSEVTRAYRAQQELTRAAVRGGVAGMVRSLATSLGGWALLLDRRGALLHSSPLTARDRVPALLPELDRLRSQNRSALSLVQADEHVSVHPVGTGARAQAFLVAGTPHTPMAGDRGLVSLAGALLAVVDDRDDEPSRRRSLALLALVRSGAVTDPAVLADLGAPVLRRSSVRVATARGPQAELARWNHGLEDAANNCLVVSKGRQSWTVISELPSTEAFRELASRSNGLQVGVSEPFPPERLADALEQAERALALAVQRHRRVVLYADVLTDPLRLIDPADATAFADRLLAPLRAEDGPGGELLIDTLRVWLEHHGQLGPAATDLGVHRHTMRHRVRRAESLLGRSLDDAETRMELWYALRVVQ